MYIYDSIKSSFTAIKSHKTRSILTLLGIVIGVSAVVSMFSTVNAIQGFIKSNMEQMGWSNSVIIVPGNNNMQYKKKRRHKMYVNRKEKPLTYNDFLHLKNNIKHKHAYASMDFRTNFNFGGKKNFLQIKGITNDFFADKTYPLQQGRYFSYYEVKNASNVCVIGSNFKDKYFKQDNPLGKQINLRGINYKIIGILKHDVLATGSNAFNFNSWERKWDLHSVYIPVTTSSKVQKGDGSIGFIYMQASSANEFSSMQNSIRQQLLARHQMAHDFSFDDIGADIAKMKGEIDGMLKKWNITLSVIASISLLVGGIGLFSTLLISINERMVEIGVRKSIGATNHDIFSYFLIEAVVLAVIGAIVGIAISNSLATLVQMFVKIPFPVPINGVLLGLGFATVIGFLSGIYPALKASKINPIEAIFYFE